MFIEINELRARPLKFDEHYGPGRIDLGEEVRQKGNLDAAGHAELIEENRGPKHKVHDIRLVGSMRADVETACARCLEPVATHIEHSFDLLYRPQGADKPADEDDSSIGPADAEIGYYTGDGVLLEDVLREQMLLAVPVKTVCSENCKGLCPHCGKNLNAADCKCAPPPADVRWGALNEIRSKLDR